MVDNFDTRKSFLAHLLGKICDYESNTHPISAEGDSPITTN